MFWPSRLRLAAELQKGNAIEKCKGGQTRRLLKVAFLWSLLQNCRCLTERLSDRKAADFPAIIAMPTRLHGLKLTAQIKAAQRRLPHWARLQRKRIHSACTLRPADCSEKITPESSHAAISADQSRGTGRKNRLKSFDLDTKMQNLLPGLHNNRRLLDKDRPDLAWPPRRAPAPPTAAMWLHKPGDSKMRLTQPLEMTLRSLLHLYFIHFLGGSWFSSTSHNSILHPPGHGVQRKAFSETKLSPKVTWVSKGRLFSWHHLFLLLFSNALPREPDTSSPVLLTRSLTTGRSVGNFTSS